MAVDHLLTQFVHHIGDVVAAFLLGDLGVEYHVKEHVPELFLKRGVILLHHGVTELIDFLDRHRPEGVDGLCVVPRTFGPQPVHHVQRPLERL